MLLEHWGNFALPGLMGLRRSWRMKCADSTLRQHRISRIFCDFTAKSFFTADPPCGGQVALSPQRVFKGKTQRSTCPGANVPRSRRTRDAGSGTRSGASAGAGNFYCTLGPHGWYASHYKSQRAESDLTRLSGLLEYSGAGLPHRGVVVSLAQ